jgi:hypothetical protein
MMGTATIWVERPINSALGLSRARLKSLKVSPVPSANIIMKTAMGTAVFIMVSVVMLPPRLKSSTASASSERRFVLNEMFDLQCPSATTSRFYN